MEIQVTGINLIVAEVPFRQGRLREQLTSSPSTARCAQDSDEFLVTVHPGQILRASPKSVRLMSGMSSTGAAVKGSSADMSLTLNEPAYRETDDGMMR
jgi:hypothetical protein